VAHNARFDLEFLNHHLEALGLPPLQNPIIDTLELAHQKLLLGSYSLGYLAKHFNIPQPQAHRAMTDVEVTRELLFKLLDINKW
jgi:ATP-dependent DNA helicase DinG